MLRVITHKTGNRCRIELHGVLGREWVPLLEQHWRAIIAEAASVKITVVLWDVQFIDPDGERLLRRMADEGVEFAVSGCMNRHVIDNLQPGSCSRRKRSEVRD
jgi:hypothetical protein